MINTPEGFDARTRCFTKPFSLGMLPKLAIKSSSTQNVSRLNPQKAADSRPPWAQKFSVRAVDTIFKYWKWSNFDMPPYMYVYEECIAGTYEY